MSLQQVLNYAAAHHEQYLEELKHILRIPSISTLPENKADVERMAEWLRVHLLEIGMGRAEIFETKGLPIVYGELVSDKTKPTVLIYGHYDVQPADPIKEWETDPFEPVIKDNFIYARGVSDDKAQFFSHLKAIESFKRAQEKLPVNIKVILEGEEEIGSKYFEEFVQAHKNLCTADVVLISDGYMASPNTPLLEIGMRGLVYFEVRLRTADHDAHSGTYGGGIANAATMLIEILSQLKDKNNVIQIPKFYEDILELTKSELDMLHADKSQFEETSRAYAFVHEKGVESHLMPKIRPSLDVNGILVGFTGSGAKTIIPATAMAKVSMRLVARQDPKKIEKLFKSYIEKLTPPGIKIEVELHSQGPPVLVSHEGNAIKTAQQALKNTFKNLPKFTREGGSIAAVEIIQRLLKTDTVLMGYGLPDDNLHAPNERFYLPNFYKGIEANIRFLKLFGQSK